MGVPPLPLGTEEIQSDWLTAALSSYAPGVNVNGFEIADINHGTCTKVRLRLDLNAAGRNAGIPDTVMLKGGFESHSRDMHYMHRMEVSAYREVLGPLGLRCPTIYFTGYDAARQQGIVIMEDLKARGVSFCHAQEPQAPEQVARRLGELARFHARTWNSPGLAPGGQWAWTNDLLPALGEYLSPFLQPEAWGRFVDSPRGAAASVRFHDPGWMQGAIERLLRLSQRMPHCVIHGDTHLGNLYVDTDGTPGFFDPQPHHAPSMVEVTYHLAGALDPADRRRSEGALLQHYLEELARCGVEAPGLEETRRHYGAFLVYGYGIFLVNESFFQPEAINTAYTARFSAAMLDNDTIGLLQAVG